MIVSERITDYINSLERSRGTLLDEIAGDARKRGIPVIREETAAFLTSMVAMKSPKAILEIGTAVGYSALLMARAMPDNCRITTIEKYEKRIPEAKRNFEQAGETGRITFLEGDAGEWLEKLTGPYDFIFMDAAKGQYLAWLPDILRLLESGGVVISDNVLQDGDIAESRYAVERRNRTIHTRMREYLYELKHMECLTTSIVPIGDGVAVSVLVQRQAE